MGKATGYPVILQGGGSIESPQSVFEAKSTQEHTLGTKGFIGPAVFYYARSSGAAITKGNLCRLAAAVANHQNLSCESAAAGASQLTVTLGATSSALNQYGGGMVNINDGTGSGQIRAIRSHPSASASATLVLTLADPLEDAVAAGDEAALRTNRFADVVVTPGNAVVRVAGAPQCDVPAGTTDSQYFWIQTYGPGVAIGDGSTFLAEGNPVTYATAGTADAGQLTTFQTASSTDMVAWREIVGIVRDIGSAASDSDYRWVDFQILA